MPITIKKIPLFFGFARGTRDLNLQQVRENRQYLDLGIAQSRNQIDLSKLMIVQRASSSQLAPVSNTLTNIKEYNLIVKTFRNPIGETQFQ